MMADVVYVHVGVFYDWSISVVLVIHSVDIYTIPVKKNCWYIYCRSSPHCQKSPLLIDDNSFCFFAFGGDVLELVEAQSLLPFADS